MTYPNVKILLIEDDKDDYLVIRDLLKDIQTTQYDLEWESDSEKAIEKIKKQEADVYLIDHRLGKTTGIEIIGKLQEENLHKPIILLTGQSDHELDIAAMESGAWDFLTKGRVTSELLERSIRYSMKRSEDVSRLRESEKHLRNKLRIFIEQAPLAIAMFDRNMNYLAVSQQWLKDYSVAESHILGKSLYEVYPEVTSEWREIHRRGLSGEYLHSDEDKFVRQDGSVQWLRWKVQPWFELDNTIGGIIILAEEITRQKEEARLKWEAEQAMKISEGANQAKSQFLANMSHEIRTPLTAILGYANLADDDSTSEKDRRKFVKIIEKNGEHLLALINDILDLSKIEAGQMHVHSINCDWKEKTEDVIQLLRPKADEKGIVLSLKFDPRLSTAFKTDCQRFRQIMFNLIGNAVKFTEKGKVEILVESIAGNNEPALKISVSDTGIGMSEEEKGKLFRVFSQVNSSHARKFGGTGLGLNISKRLANALGGDLTLKESAPGKGSTFVLTLPLRAADKSQVKNLKTLNRDDSGFGLKILLVEDSPDNQELVRRFLGSADFQVETVDNGRDAIDKALKGNFDAVLMDIEMPGMDGYEATSTLRSLGFNKPIIALTAHAFTYLADNAMEVGFTGYITKPFRKDSLIKSLIGFIENDPLVKEMC